MIEKLNPVNDYVLVRLREGERTTESGLSLPDTDTTSDEGQILKCGPDVKHLESGKSVYYVNGKGHLILIEDDNYLLIKEKHVLATF